MVQTMKMVRVTMYTGFLPKASDTGPANSDPNPNPIRKLAKEQEDMC